MPPASANKPLNFYSVPFHDNDPSRPSLHENPADELAHIVGLYGKRHPIAIGEYGVSHRAAADGVDRTEWAADTLQTLYAALPRLWPQVKLVNCFDMDNLRHAQPGRQLNNYRITDGRTLLDAYRDAIRDPWFLGRVGETPPANAPVALGKAPLRVPQGPLELSVWSRCWSSRHAVRYRVEGTVLTPERDRGGRTVVAMLHAPGETTLQAEVLDARGRVAASATHRVVVS